MATISSSEGGGFVGRKEVMDFINTTLELHLTRVEETASGCVALQLLDIMYPNVVSMEKVNWGASKDYECIANYKILQVCFTKLNIDRRIDVNGLISGRYLDNLEFMQWIKRYYELAFTVKGNYDCLAQRKKGKHGTPLTIETRHPVGVSIARSPSSLSTCPSSPTKSGSFTSSTSATASPVKPTTPKSVIRSAKPTTPTRQSVPSPTGATSAFNRTITANPVKKRSTSVSGVRTATPPVNQKVPDLNLIASENAQLSAKVKSLTAENDLMKVTGGYAIKAMTKFRNEMDELEKERNFYFGKLRNIEIILQDNEDVGKSNELTTSVFMILYATQDGSEGIDTDTN